mgnify:CR=1 FL=1
MKKVIASILAVVMLLFLVACGTTEGDESSAAASSTPASTSKDESKTTSSDSDDESSTASSDTSSEESDPGPELPAYLTNFVSFAEARTPTLKATDKTSVRLTKIDEAPVEGDIVLFTNAYGDTIAADDETYADFAIVVFEYDHDVFTYVQKSLAEVGEDDTKADTAIPEDGFVLAISSLQTQALANLKNITDKSIVHVHGVQTLAVDEYGITVNKIETAPTIDGVVTEDEWGTPVWDVDEDNKYWSYSSFEKNNYYATAKIYARCDDKNLYFAVVVDSPYHYCPLDQSGAGGMYSYECIQVNIADQSPLSDYMLENFDWAVNKKSSEEGHIRQYGFAASSNEGNETLSVVWMAAADQAKFTGNCKVVRDEDNKATTYEVSIPWAEIGLDKVDSGTEFGFSISINSTNEADIEAGTWKNITLRDGGGIIGRNDWSKIPVATIES